jgi:hypothetical protein
MIDIVSASPFIGGGLILAVGSYVQTYMVERICRDRTDITLKGRLTRDGDLVQLVCTYLAVVPAGVALFYKHLPMLTFMILGALIGIVVSSVKLLNANPDKYYSRRLCGMTGATTGCLAYCLVGAAYALFWSPV